MKSLRKKVEVVQQKELESGHGRVEKGYGSKIMRNIKEEDEVMERMLLLRESAMSEMLNIIDRMYSTRNKIVNLITN